MSSRVFVSFGEGKVVSVVREPRCWRPSRGSPYTSLFRNDGSVTETQKQKATLMGGWGALNGWTGSIQWEDGEHLMDGPGGFDDGRMGSIGWVDREHLMGGWGALDGWTGSIRWEDGEHSVGRRGAFNGGWAGSI